jgi:hemoglobin-like flavoprotein
MTPRQIDLVQASFAKVAPIADQAAALFYDRLFATDPGTRALFAHADLAAQGRKLMAAIGFVVGALRRPEAMLGTVRDLARRHVGYGVQDHHYATVGAALLWTLEQGLGDAFTPETREAWAAAYGLLTSVMLEAAAQEAGAMAA